MQRTHILSTGSFLPEKITANEELTQFLPEARKLIAEKTGVQARRHAGKSECTSDLAVSASRKCLQKIDFPPDNVQGIVLSASSPDRMQPAAATHVQHELGAVKAFAFDIDSIFSGGSFFMNGPRKIKKGFTRLRGLKLNETRVFRVSTKRMEHRLITIFCER